MRKSKIENRKLHFGFLARFAMTSISYPNKIFEMKTYNLFLPLILICSSQVFAQKKSFSVGVQTRVTPIYVAVKPTEAFFSYSNIFDDSNPNFTGPGVTIDYRYKIKEDWELGFGTVVRYDKLYIEYDFFIQANGQPKRKIQRSFFLDNYADVKYTWKKADRRTTKFVGLGLVMAGIGTGYTKTQITEIAGVVYPTQTKEHYQFPAVFTSFGWRFQSKLNAELKMGYCWSNPQRYFNSTFLFPELKVSYDLVKW